MPISTQRAIFRGRAMPEASLFIGGRAILLRHKQFENLNDMDRILHTLPHFVSLGMVPYF